MSILSLFKGAPHSVRSVNAAEFKTAIDNKQVQLIDVRTAQEYAQGTIGEARLMDVTARDFARKIDQLDPTRPVALFCHSGGRSIYAAKLIAGRGFPVIYNLKGGIALWR